MGNVYLATEAFSIGSEECPSEKYYELLAEYIDVSFEEFVTITDQIV